LKAHLLPPGSNARPISPSRDPALGDTVRATVIEATAAGSEASFEVGASVQTLTQLLATPGAALVFAVPVPEPGIGAGLRAGALLLAALAKRRSPTAHGRPRRRPGV